MAGKPFNFCQMWQLIDKNFTAPEGFTEFIEKPFPDHVKESA